MNQSDERRGRSREKLGGSKTDQEDGGKAGSLIRDVSTAILGRFTRDKPCTSPVTTVASSSSVKRGQEECDVARSKRITVTETQSLSQLSLDPEHQTTRKQKPSLLSPSRYSSRFRTHSGSQMKSSQGDQTVRNGRVDVHADAVYRNRTREERTSSEILDQILKEQDQLRQECSDLKKQLSEKEELVQTLVNQQLKHQTDDAIERSPVYSYSDHSKEISQLQIELRTLQLSNENHVFELTETEEEIRVLKERYESRHQRIKSLEQQKSEMSVQAKTFEVNYHAELEQNQQLQRENERLKHQLDTQCTSVAGAADCKDNGIEVSECNCTHRNVIARLRDRVKELNEDIATVREHTKEQSRQILIHRQQAEMSEEIEGQLRSMEGKHQELQEEQDKLQKELKKARAELHRLQNERKLLDNELETSKKETMRFIQAKDNLKRKYDVLEAEQEQLLKNMERMSELSVQLVNANKTIKELEQQVAVAQVQMKQYQDDFSAERQDRENAHGVIADLEKERVKIGERSTYQQVRDELRAAELAKEELQHDLERVRAEAIEQHEMLHQEMLAKSSQVKQYAKENDRLKKALEAATSKQTSETPLGNAESRQFSKCSQEDLQNLLDENSHFQERIGQLEKINAQLREYCESQMASATSASLPAETSENGAAMLNSNFVRRPVKSWPQDDGYGQSSEIPQSGKSVETDSANSQGSLLATEVAEHDRVGGGGLRHSPQQSPHENESWPINQVPEEETPVTILKKTKELSAANNHFHVDVQQEGQADYSHLQPPHLNQHHVPASFDLSPTHHSQGNMLNCAADGKQIIGSGSNCQAIQLDDFNNRECIQASNPLEDSDVLFENPLQRELDDEIHQQAARVIQEVSGSRRDANTDRKRPFDPNLVCPMCRKQFRIGEIQRFRRHVNTCTGTSDD